MQDATGELHVSNSKLRDIETAYTTQKSEYERLKKLYADVEEKATAAELQIKHLSSDYRTQLQQKEVMISHLKSRQNALQDQVQKLQSVARTTQTETTSTASADFLPGDVPHALTFDGDTGDFGDVIWSQHEINRLSKEVSRLETIVAHWKALAEENKGQGTLSSDQDDVYKLQKTIEEVKQQLSREIDEHQHELSTLQDVHQQKITTLTNRHRGELAEYEERIEELEQQLQDTEKDRKGTNNSHDNNFNGQEDVQELKASLHLLNHEKEELQKEKVAFQQELANLQASQRNESDLNSLALEVSELRHNLLTKESELTEISMQRDTLMTELEELDKQNQEATEHLIRSKDQLAQQRKDSEEKIVKLQSELEILVADKASMVQELETQRGKLSQSAFALNELHMSKQQLDMKVNDLTEKLHKSQVDNSGLKAEVTSLARRLQDTESQLAVAKTELTQAVQQTPSNVCQEELLQDKDREISELRKQVLETRCISDELQTELYDLKIRNKKLVADNDEANVTLGRVREQLEETVFSNSEFSKETSTLLEAVRMEKVQLQSELSQAEKRLNEEAQKYEQTIKELTEAQSLDATTLQKEHNRLIKSIQEKDFTIEELKRNKQLLELDHDETKEMLKSSLEGQQQLTDLLKEKETFVETLKARGLELQQEIEKNVKIFRECESLKHNLEERDRQLSVMKEENNHLKEEIDRLGDQQSRSPPIAEPKTLDIITELETEITELNNKRNSLEEEVRLHKKSVEEQKQNVLQLQRSAQDRGDEAKTQCEEITSTYEKIISEKDDKIGNLQESINQLKMQKEFQVVPTDAPVILQEIKVQTVNGENGNEKHDLSKVEIDRLVHGVKEKEREIKLLNEKNLALIKQLDQLSLFKDEVVKLTHIIQQKNVEIQTLNARVTSGIHGQMGADVAYLQQQLQVYAMEREQVLAVLNEKTRENSQLKTEYHRMMDIIAAKEAALLKLQEENLRMVNKAENEGEDMVRETIQNLSRIIREKDIEIDALRQKCQTLVTVLQTSGMGSNGQSGLVSSNQFEELLQERDKLKQQVKKMEEWKQQVITTVQNMQHESAQLQDELLKLQGRLSTDGDCNSRLQIDYNSLIHSYEQKEKKLQTLSQELAEVQQSIGQLSSTKHLILDKLDSVPPEPQVVATSTGILHMEPSSHGSSSVENLNQIKELQQKVERLSKILEGKEATIVAFQNSAESLAPKPVNGKSDVALEVKQMKDKNAELQRSFREKDLLIKSKSDQLLSVTGCLRNKDNENEVLKQAVTNLKERVSLLEIDIRKSQEENDQIIAKSREKETEFRALQETNMQFSMMLREKEFESNSMREKASALEKVLKEKEEGKTGELNQLLYEVKSMQEQAGMFQHERDQVMLALKQKQMEATALVNELQHMRDKEQRLNQELQRLRSHLLEMEESYTKEALAAEDRETELRRKITFLEKKLASSSCAVESASHQASLQVESLQEQLQVIAKQRDEAVMQLSTSQDQVKQYAMSLTNLQMVIEQFQKEEKAMYATELEKYQKDIAEWKKKALSLEKTVAELEEHLQEANAALDSASRLTDQLDLKEEQVEYLQKEVVAQKDMLEDGQRKLLSLVNNNEGKIDKVLMRNLFVGYFHTPKNKRNEAMRLMGSVLGLRREEISQLLESEHRGVTGWVTSWLGSRASGTQSVPNTPQRPNQQTVFNNSFSEMFVKFLEIESRPSLPPPKLPIYDIHPLGHTPAASQQASGTSGASGAGQLKKPESSPFLAPRSAAVPLMTSAAASSAGSPHLLMKPISSALPTFTPLPVSSDSSAGTVLKDLLKQ